MNMATGMILKAIYEFRVMKFSYFYDFGNIKIYVIDMI